MNLEALARIAYGVWRDGAYRDASPYIIGLKLPEWEDLYDVGRTRWIAVVEAVLAASKTP